MSERIPTKLRLPDRYATCDFGNFDPSVSKAASAALQAARFMVDSESDPEGRHWLTLMLVGRPGAGKTHLAAAICNETHRRDVERDRARVQDPGRHVVGMSVIGIPQWCNVPELLVSMRREMRSGDTDAADLANMLGTWPGIVVLDDLGREKVSEWTSEVVYVLLNRRYERMLQTVVTSNLTVAELEANGYGAVVSRLAEDGALIEMASAKDYRTRRPAA